jgi:fumarylacetoacetase
MKSWIEIKKDADFTIFNIPFGIYNAPLQNEKIVCTAIGDYIVNLYAIAKLGLFKDIDFNIDILKSEFLNDFIALGKPITSRVRERLIEIFDDSFSYQHIIRAHWAACMVDYHPALMSMPIKIGDYTDFYSSKEHATNVGIMFRDPANALLPNWLHMPVGYHGRASSIVVSGTPIKRPKGQLLPPEGGETPIFGESKRLDFELEMGFVVGKSTTLGTTVDVNDAEDHIFGLCIFNDWSARDIQQWEYVPLGPFLGKNFGSSISPWIVTLEALAPFREESPALEKPILPYLKSEGKKNFDIALEVQLNTETGSQNTICNSNFKYMYWNMSQQLAHHTVNGCNVNIGDVCASGTISGHTPDSYGSMLELAWKGTKPIQLNDGTERRFVQDGDTIVMKAKCSNGEITLGFGEVTGKIMPAD